MFCPEDGTQLQMLHEGPCGIEVDYEPCPVCGACWTYFSEGHYPAYEMRGHVDIDDEDDRGWYFRLRSEEYGTEFFGPYDTREHAQGGIDRIQESAADLDDGIEREFFGPYQGYQREED